mmetsp:Transcript_14616/g.41644  ORF Transcript_14616/g.41644 Transcript_14616/m.41644 type:complete len:257 (+) Transcript_14616:714-1484(+)
MTPGDSRRTRSCTRIHPRVAPFPCEPTQISVEQLVRISPGGDLALSEPFTPATSIKSLPTYPPQFIMTQSRLPTYISSPSMVATMPLPGCVSEAATFPMAIFLTSAYSLSAVAIGCIVCVSAVAASRMSSFPSTPASMSVPEGVTETTCMFPSVSVPVLSKTTAVTSAMRSIIWPPLTKIPRLAAEDDETRTAVGVARPSAQGHATTSTSMASLRLNRATLSFTSTIASLKAILGKVWSPIVYQKPKVTAEADMTP